MEVGVKVDGVMLENDWRMTNQKRYLQGKHLARKHFIPTDECDHVHCVFCWDKFGENEGWLHIGYRVEENNSWICEQCFLDFKDEFKWHIKGQGDGLREP